MPPLPEPAPPASAALPAVAAEVARRTSSVGAGTAGPARQEAAVVEEPASERHAISADAADSRAVAAAAASAALAAEHGPNVDDLAAQDVDAGAAFLTLAGAVQEP